MSAAWRIILREFRATMLPARRKSTHPVRLGRPDLPILFITGFAGVALPPTDSRPDRLLRKPFHASELAAEVAALLAACGASGNIVRLRCPV